MKVSIIVPVYNEVLKVRRALAEIADVKILDKEIVVVDDGSTDGTLEALEYIPSDVGFTFNDKKYNTCVRVIPHKVNRGKGAAIRTGIKAATGDIIVFFDADLEYDAEDIPTLIQPIVDLKFAAVYGSRFLNRDNRFLKVSWLANKVLSGLTNILIRQEITDMETGLKAFKADTLKALALEQDRFGIEPEITVKIAKADNWIYEVPARYWPRSYGQGKKVKPVDGLRAIWYLLKYTYGG